MIRKTAACLVCIAWALWLGGLGALFLFVTRLFAFNPALAKQAAPLLFHVFEKYQIVLAAASLLGAAVWRVFAKSSRATALFWMLGIASALAAAGPMLITSKMDALMASDQSDSPEFRKLHGESMMIYSAEMLILLSVGFTLPWALREPDRGQAVLVSPPA
jgi:hypothetical protein